MSTTILLTIVLLLYVFPVVVTYFIIRKNYEDGIYRPTWFAVISVIFPGLNLAIVIALIINGLAEKIKDSDFPDRFFGRK